MNYSVRSYDVSRVGEPGFVFTQWVKSWLHAWSPWPKLSDWDKMEPKAKASFIESVKAQFSPRRVQRPARSLWVKANIDIIRHWMEHGLVKVAHPEGDPNVLVGFAVWSKTGVPVYVFVVPTLRRKGIGSKLLGQSFKDLATNADKEWGKKDANG